MGDPDSVILWTGLIGKNLDRFKTDVALVTVRTVVTIRGNTNVWQLAVAIAADNLHVIDVKLVAEVTELGLKRLLPDPGVARQAIFSSAAMMTIVAAVSRETNGPDSTQSFFVTRMAFLTRHPLDDHVRTMSEATAEDTDPRRFGARVAAETRRLEWYGRPWLRQRGEPSRHSRFVQLSMCCLEHAETVRYVVNSVTLLDELEIRLCLDEDRRRSNRPGTCRGIDLAPQATGPFFQAP